jgi:excinuclease UvrABC ATPase subunit
MATYTGLLDPIRKLFADANHVSATLFSANSAGACPGCKGLGTTTLDLAFMDPIESTCEVCHGKRFTPEVLHHVLRGKNIHEVLELSATEAREFFDEPQLRETLQRLIEVGLGYMSLGQPLSTLSGGERQRIKLAAELEKSGQIYVLDEPTTGLHLSDIDRLQSLMNRLVEQGSTLLVIEHNLEVIAQADWVIEMGPGAGRDGGQVVFQGTAERLAADADSLTGIHLKRHLRGWRDAPRIASAR